MTTILTPNEAATYCRTNAEDPLLLQLMPQVDDYLERATGRDWTQDASIYPVAKSAALILLINWYDDPAQVGIAPSHAMGPMVQLEAEALKYRKYSFYGLNGVGAITLYGACVGDTVEKLVGIYGVSGDQGAKFEAVISVTDQIQQTDAGDLSKNIYAVILKSPIEDVVA